MGVTGKTRSSFGRKLLIGLVFFLIAVIIGMTLFLVGYVEGQKSPEEPVQVIEIGLIEAQIRDIGELATIEYRYTDAAKFEQGASWIDLDWDIFKKSFVAAWDGTIKVGIDINEVKVTHNEVNKVITVHLPEAKILSHEIDTESFRILDEEDGLFNPVELEDLLEFETANKEVMENKVIQRGIPEEAFENAKDIISKLVYTDTLKDLGYIVVFEKIAD